MSFVDQLCCDPDCIEENVSSILAPFVKKFVFQICRHQDFTILDSNVVHTKGFILQRNPRVLLLSHYVDDCDDAFEVSLSNVKSTLKLMKTTIDNIGAKDSIGDDLVSLFQESDSDSSFSSFIDV